MAIDVDRPGSPGWWLWKLSEEQRQRRKRLDSLWERYEGRPPLPVGAENAREAFQDFQRLARSNLADLAVQAVAERCSLIGFRTSAEQAAAEVTDEVIGAIWEYNQMAMQVQDVHEYMGAMGCGYTIVGPAPDDEEDPRSPFWDPDLDVDEPDGELDSDEPMPLITVEDPRDVITAQDPARSGRTLAAIKYKYDPQDDVDRIFVLMRGGLIYRARRSGRKTGSTQFGPKWRFSPKGWEWENFDDPDTLPTADVPVTWYRNPRDKAAFEQHIDVMDRVNHQILQRMSIAVMQAFRQRAVKGLPEKDDDGNVIDYEGIFSADPAAIWQLPEAAEMWESGQVDLTPILSAVKDDVREFMGNTRTPMTYYTPDAANGSAEGASLTREGLTFKVENTFLYAGAGHTRTARLALRYHDRDDLAKKVLPLWAPAERFSLAQRYDAAEKGRQAGVPWRTRMLSILQFSPAEVARMEVERLQEQLLGGVAAEQDREPGQGDPDDDPADGGQ
ncbi:phage portal protein [Pseudonocardia kongjuensis]|uniref:Phage portal protein n=1 Tax=Pseudonocardia kongjuensis TaxID=102227 RepID=A0ABP4J342_9PSEU